MSSRVVELDLATTGVDALGRPMRVPLGVEGADLLCREIYNLGRHVGTILDQIAKGLGGLKKVAILF